MLYNGIMWKWKQIFDGPFPFEPLFLVQTMVWFYIWLIDMTGDVVCQAWIIFHSISTVHHIPHALNKADHMAFIKDRWWVGEGSYGQQSWQLSALLVLWENLYTLYPCIHWTTLEVTDVIDTFSDHIYVLWAASIDISWIFVQKINSKFTE